MISKSTISCVGFGLDAQYRNQYPKKLSGLCDHFRDCLSHISIVSLRDEADAYWLKNEVSKGTPTVHHLSGIAPGNPDGLPIVKLKLQEKISQIINASWCGEDIGIWNIGPYSLPYFAPPLLNEEICDKIIDDIYTMKQEMHTPFLAEIPSCTLAVGNMDLGEFFVRLVDSANIGMVLDLSHVYSYALATGKNYRDVFFSLPLDAAVEFHIAGGRVSNKCEFRYLDTHSDNILPEIYDLLKEGIHHCPNLRAITYEIGNKLTLDKIQIEMSKLTDCIRSLNFQPRLDAN